MEKEYVNKQTIAYDKYYDRNKGRAITKNQPSKSGLEKLLRGSI